MLLHELINLHSKPDQLWHDQWYDTKWGDDPINKHHDPIKIIYSRMFKDVVDRLFPQPIIDHLIGYHLWDTGGNDIVSILLYDDLEKFEKFLELEQPQPKQILNELEQIGNFLHEIYKIFQNNDDTLLKIKNILAIELNRKHSTKNNKESYDDLIKTITPKILDVATDLTSIEITEHPSGEMIIVDPIKLPINIDHVTMTPLVGMIDNTQQKHLQLDILKVLSDALIVEVWKMLFEYHGIKLLNLIHINHARFSIKTLKFKDINHEVI